jgi:membrane-bound ClpP family serine protease
MDSTLYLLEKILLTLGILVLLTSMVRYGKRTSDWKGVAMMAFKRVPMSAVEFRYYRLGVALVILAVVLKIVVLTLWPTL